jgi:hypothetical protein
VLEREAAMKHSSIRDLYGYWNQRRGMRAAPERADIDPTAIPRLLADTFLLGADDKGGLVFRLAGTRVCALFCRELKGENVAALFGDRSRSEIDDLLALVCDEQVATVAGLSAHLGDATSAQFELLLLPLRHHGRTDSRILGALVPVTPTYWIGAVPTTSLTLEAWRHITPRGMPAAIPTAGSPPPDAGRMRRGFVVYDGGRS